MTCRILIIGFKNILGKRTYNETYWTDAPIGIIQAGGIRTAINETDHDGILLHLF